MPISGLRIICVTGAGIEQRVQIGSIVLRRGNFILIWCATRNDGMTTLANNVLNFGSC